MESNGTRRGAFGDPQRDSYTWSELHDDDTVVFTLDDDPWAWAAREPGDEPHVDV